MEKEKQPPKSPRIPRYSDNLMNRMKESAQKYAELFKATPQPPAQNKTKQFFFLRVKSVGVGAHSFVYLVQEESSHMLLAQKSITLEHARQNAADLLRQIKVQSFCSHQNLIQLYHVYSTTTHINLVMEFAQDSLFNLKQKFKIFKEKQVLEVMKQLLTGLDYLHQKEIVHADLKLQNVMIANGKIKLCDFGYAHQVGQEKGSMVGTMEYLAPEYAQGTDSAMLRDIWAVGIIAFEMLVGRNPFEEMKESEKWARIVKEPPQSYLKELVFLQKQMGRESPKVEEILSHILTDWHQRWPAEKLLTMQGFGGGSS